MREIRTTLTEQQFLTRLEQMCKIKVRLDSDYSDIDTFVVKRRGNKFWLGKHYASVGRIDGYASDRLNCCYFLNENGLVVVQYYYAKHPIYQMPSIIAFLVGLFFAPQLAYMAILYDDMQWGGFVVAMIFLAFGIRGFFYSKKERSNQEKHLKRICKAEQ